MSDGADRIDFLLSQNKLIVLFVCCFFCFWEWSHRSYSQPCCNKYLFFTTVRDTFSVWLRVSLLLLYRTSGSVWWRRWLLPSSVFSSQFEPPELRRNGSLASAGEIGHPEMFGPSFEEGAIGDIGSCSSSLSGSFTDFLILVCFTSRILWQMKMCRYECLKNDTYLYVF